MSQDSGEPSLVVTGGGDVRAGSFDRLDYRVEDLWLLGRVAADHITRHGYETGRVEFSRGGLQVELPHRYSDGDLTHEYRVDGDGAVYARHSVPTAADDLSDAAADALHDTVQAAEMKRLVARANKIAWFADEIIDIHDRNPAVAESILREYRWGPVLEPERLARHVSRLDGDAAVPPEALRDAGFGATDVVLRDAYEDVYDALLDRAARGERAGMLDFEEGTKTRSLQDFYDDTAAGDEMRIIYRKAMDRVIGRVSRETGMDIEPLSDAGEA